MKQLSLLIALLIGSIAGYSQTAASYSFTATSGTFIDISSTGIIANDATGDDNTQTDIPIGFFFNFCGVNYDHVSACSNGWLNLANSSSAVRANENRSNILPGGFLMAYWDDLRSNGSDYTTGDPLADGTPYYQTIGTTVGSRMFVFEWKGWYNYNNALTGNTQDMEIVLYESTGVVEIIYNNGTLGTTSVSGSSVF